eukprot:1966952-Amphidinium_carterae.1
MGAMKGSEVFDILGSYPPEIAGQSLRVKLRGTSSAAQRGEGWACGDPLQPLLHICRGGRGACAFNVPSVMVVHAEWFRLRNVTSLTEDWLTCR